MYKSKFESGFLDSMDGKTPSTSVAATQLVAPPHVIYPSHVDGRCNVAANGVDIATVLNDQVDDRRRSASYNGLMKGCFVPDTYLDDGEPVLATNSIRASYTLSLNRWIFPEPSRCPRLPSLLRKCLQNVGVVHTYRRLGGY